TMAILPYIEQEALYQRILQDGYVNIVGGVSAPSALGPTILYCPAEPGNPLFDLGGGSYRRLMSYGANVGTEYLTDNCDALIVEDPTNPVANQLPKRNGLFYQNSRVQLASVTDGTSNTILLGERTLSDPNLDQAGRRLADVFCGLFGMDAAAYAAMTNKSV